MSHLVSNATLAQITQKYTLMRRIHVAPSARMAVQSSEKNQANLFEAYIAGYFESILHPSSSPSSDQVSNGNGNGNSEHGAKTEGQAYDEVSAWLIPIFTPIAHFLREHLQAEQHRKSQIGPEDDGDDHIDPALVTGSSARLNEYFIGRLGTGMPQYDSYMLPDLLWKTTCTVKLRNGQTM